MSEKIKKNKVTIIIVLVVLSLISAIVYINLQENKTMEVEAIVKLIGENYIVVEDDKGDKYSLETNDEYNIGDRVDFLIKKIKNDCNPIEGTLVKIDTISKDISFSITDDTSIQGEITNNTDTNKNNETTNNNPSNENTAISSPEEAVVTYFTKLNNDLTTYNQDKNISDSLKQGFITIVDFLFYNGKISGKTFEELSNTAKIKVLQLAFSIDEKIEKHFPGYKEEISTKTKDIYTSFKTKAIELYLDLTTSICDKDPDTCESAKQGLTDLKQSFSLTWDIIKNASTEGLTKLKEWYEIWKAA